MPVLIDKIIDNYTKQVFGDDVNNIVLNVTITGLFLEASWQLIAVDI